VVEIIRMHANQCVSSSDWIMRPMAVCEVEERLTNSMPRAMTRDDLYSRTSLIKRSERIVRSARTPAPSLRRSPRKRGTISNAEGAIESRSSGNHIEHMYSRAMARRSVSHSRFTSDACAREPRSVVVSLSLSLWVLCLWVGQRGGPGGSETRPATRRWRDRGGRRALMMVIFCIVKNWKIRSRMKTRSITRLVIHSGLAGSTTGGRKPTSKGVTSAVKMSANAVTTSHHG
jgi:hypothetical protein